jgi:squalene-associated FAD-dependent desaturase
VGRVPSPGRDETVSRQEPATVRVTVVGGGLAGIAAALACADAGAEVTLWEAKKWLGGATSSFERDGLTIDTGQHVFLRCCVAYREFLRRVGMEGRTDLQSRLDIPIVAPGGRTSGIRRTSLPAPLHLGRALLSYRFLSRSERVHAAITGLAIRRLDPRDPAVDEQAFGTWLRARGESPRAIRALWDLIGLPTLNVEADGASLALAAKVFRTGLLDASGAADIGVPIVPLQELHGDAGLRALRAAGATVRLGERVRGLAVTADGVTGVETDTGTVAADAAIIAVPNDRVGDVLPDGAVPDPAAFARLGSSPIVNIHVVYDRPVLSRRFVAAVDSPVQWMFDRSGASGLEHGQYVAVSLSGADAFVDRTVDDLRAEFLPAIEALLPRARGANVDRFLVTRERQATFRQSPGTLRLRPRAITSIPRLYLAGAWTDTGWPATMEGAVRSGRTAARAALMALGRTERLPAEIAA